MKRLLALVLALALCVTLFAFAETAPEEPEMVASPSLDEEYLALLSAVMAKSCQHIYTRTTYETDLESAGYTDNGDGTHTFNGDCFQVTRCLDCGMKLSREPVEGVTFTEPHDYTYSYDGSCDKCGAACQHNEIAAGSYVDKAVVYRSALSRQIHDRHRRASQEKTDTVEYDADSEKNSDGKRRERYCGHRRYEEDFINQRHDSGQI